MGASTDTVLFQSLHRRPEARTITVRELIHKMRNGEIRVPQFQRPLRWRAEDVRKLLDSIWRGYPVGSLLFWKRKAEAETLRVGGAHLDAPAVPDAWHVVDGQQRVTALAAALLDLDHGDERRWTHTFDVDNRTFYAGDPPPERVGIDVPVRVLGDLSRLGRWLRQHAVEDETVIARIEEAQQALLDYAIPVYIVDTDDERALRGVFARLNSTGARMRADEVFQALLGSGSGDRDALDLTKLQENCDVDGFGAPPRSEVLKAVLAMSGLDPTRRAEQLAQEELTRLVSEDAAEEALRAALSFLREDAGIPHWRLIPYPVVFVILSRFFLVHGESWGDRNTNRLLRIELARWLWRGTVQGSHQRAAVSKMRHQIRAIDPAATVYDSLDRLHEAVPSTAPAEWSLEPFDQRSARSRIEVLALLTLEPRDDTGLITVHDLSSDERFAREVFTTTSLRGEPDDVRRLGRTAANRVVLHTATSGLHAWLRDVHDAEHGHEILKSHLVTEDMVKALKDQDRARFLQDRARLLQSLTTAFLDRRCGWGEPRVRPVEFYLDSPAENEP